MEKEIDVRWNCVGRGMLSFKGELERGFGMPKGGLEPL
jgi:hypothetical protein